MADKNINDIAVVAALKASLGIADEGNATDYFYLKSEVDSLVGIASEANLLNGLKQAGTGIVAIPFGAYIMLQDASTMNDGRTYSLAVIPTRDIVANHIGYKVTGAQAVYTADAYNGLDICELVDGNLVQLAKTVNDGEMWKTLGYAHKAITEVTLLAGHIYYLRAVWNASSTTTAPTYANWGLAWASLPNTTFRPAIYNSKTDLVTGDAASTYNASLVMFGMWLEYIS